MKKFVSLIIAILVFFSSFNVTFSIGMSTYENLKSMDDEFITRLMNVGATEEAIENFVDDMDATVAGFQEKIYLSDIDMYFITILLQNMQLQENMSILIAFDMAYQDEILYMSRYKKVPECMKNFKIAVFGDKIIVDIGLADKEDEEIYYPEEVTPIIPEIVLPFDDIKHLSWCVESVLYLYENGIVSGTGERTFEPEKPITREEFLKMIVSATLDLNNYYHNEFGLSAIGQWYHPYLATAEFYSLTQGIYDEDVFENDVYITRQDMTTIAYRAVKRAEIELPDIKHSTDFVDVTNISYYALEPIKELQEANIIHGTGNNMFEPYNSTTRAEAAKIVYSIMKLKSIDK